MSPSVRASIATAHATLTLIAIGLAIEMPAFGADARGGEFELRAAGGAVETPRPAASYPFCRFRSPTADLAAETRPGDPPVLR